MEIYDREYNTPDPTGVHNWDTMRDLGKIWTTRGKIGFGFDESNTIMVDDSPRKMRSFSGNAVIVPEYGERDIERDGGESAAAGGAGGGAYIATASDAAHASVSDSVAVSDVNRSVLSVLGCVRVYLTHLLQECPPLDVREYIPLYRPRPPLSSLL